MDATDDVALDRVAVEDGVVGNAKSAFFKVVVEGLGDETLDLCWEV